MRTQHRFLLPLAFLALLAAVPARAEGPSFELTPFGGYRLGGSFDVEDDDGNDRSVDIDNGGSWGVDLGIYRDPVCFCELLYIDAELGLRQQRPDARARRRDHRVLPRGRHVAVRRRAKDLSQAWLFGQGVTWAGSLPWESCLLRQSTPGAEI